MWLRAELSDVAVTGGNSGDQSGVQLPHWPCSGLLLYVVDTGHWAPEHQVPGHQDLPLMLAAVIESDGGDV